jgi:hypothetical protein
VARNVSFFELPEYTAILTFIDAVFSEINIGLLIYHAKDPELVDSYQLIYANRQASQFTGTDLSHLVGKKIFDAFPPLRDTEIPAFFREVAIEGESRRLARTLEYADENVVRGRYSVKAFPMPHGCIGVLFENLSQLDAD